jgi:hypothetical protein
MRQPCLARSWIHLLVACLTVAACGESTNPPAASHRGPPGLAGARCDDQSECAYGTFCDVLHHGSCVTTAEVDCSDWDDLESDCLDAKGCAPREDSSCSGDLDCPENQGCLYGQCWASHDPEVNCN